jgi:hypothetical protein
LVVVRIAARPYRQLDLSAAGCGARRRAGLAAPTRFAPLEVTAWIRTRRSPTADATPGAARPAGSSAPTKFDRLRLDGPPPVSGTDRRGDVGGSC